MNKLELAEMNTIDSITSYYSKKVIRNFRNEKWDKNISSQVSVIINKFKNTIYDEVRAEVEIDVESRLSKKYNMRLHEESKELRIGITKELEEKYKNHIEKPSNSIGVRLRFLFTGKLF